MKVSAGAGVALLQRLLGPLEVDVLQLRGGGDVDRLPVLEHREAHRQQAGGLHLVFLILRAAQELQQRPGGVGVFGVLPDHEAVGRAEHLADAGRAGRYVLVAPLELAGGGLDHIERVGAVLTHRDLLREECLLAPGICPYAVLRHQHLVIPHQLARPLQRCLAFRVA